MISELLEYIEQLEVNLNNDLEGVKDEEIKQLINTLLKTAWKFKEDNGY